VHTTMETDLLVALAVPVVGPAHRPRSADTSVPLNMVADASSETRLGSLGSAPVTALHHSSPFNAITRLEYIYRLYCSHYLSVVGEEE